MSHRKPLSTVLKATALGAMAVLALSCSTDSPTAPNPNQGGQNPGTSPGAGSWAITVTADPNVLTLPAAGTAQPVPTSTVTVKIRSAQTGGAPPNGSTFSITVSPPSLGTLDGTAQVFNGDATFRFVPSGSPGTATIAAQYQSSAGQAQIVINEAGEATPFMITHLDPTVGSPSGGEVVNIFGQQIQEPVRVTFNGQVAEVLSVTPNRIRVRTPAFNGNVPVGETRSVAVAVTNAFGTTFAQTDSLPNAFVYAHGGSIAQPTIFSITPATGPNEGGTPIRIKGTGFESPVQVLFGAVGQSVEAQVQSVTSSEIVVVSPPARDFGQSNLNESVSITVINLNSGFRSTVNNAFRYGVPVIITSIAPGEGPATGGTLVTVFGQGFDEPVAVSMGGLAQQIVSVTGTEILVRTVPVEITSCSDVTGPTQVVNIETGASATGPTFRYRVAKPIITGVAPASGPQGGGTVVTISGGNFTQGMRVKFGDRVVAPTSVTSTQIKVTAPQFTGTFNQVSCDANNDGQVGFQFVPTSVDITIDDTSTSCTDTFADAFAYNPSNTSCQNDVAPPPPPEPQCNDGQDNDNDTLVDFPNDPGCTSADDNTENSA